MNNLKQNLRLHIQKSYVEGIYSDNSQNRKLGRVGMSYGHKLNLSNFEDEPDNGDTFATNPKLILKRAKSFLSDKSFEFIKNLMEQKGFKEGDLYEYKGKIYFSTTNEVSPERDKNIINLGTRKINNNEENSYYKFIRDTWNPEKLEKDSLSTFIKKESWGDYKSYSMLALLKIEDDHRRYILDDIKRDLWWKKYDSGEVSKDSHYSDISDEEAEKYIKIHGRKIVKDDLAYSSRHKSFIKSLKEFGIPFDNFDRENIDEFKNKFKEYIINCPRNDFYQMVKGCSLDPSYINKLIRLRFAFKYNKMIAGNGWDSITDEKGKIDIKKRDEVLELCKQIEYAVDDVLGEDKDLFINNSNIDFIRFDEKTSWGGASYSRNDKTITITSEYFQAMKDSRKNDDRANTLSREKFLVEGFIHEIGHSLDTTEDIYDSSYYKDFAEHLGYGENRKYTIFTNAIKEDSDFFEYQDNYLSIKRDKKEALIEKFGPLYETYYNGAFSFDNRELSSLFISSYSSKSASEGFAEYFSFYMGNKKFLDKEIENYKKNPKEYLSKVDINNWYKYSVYGGKWNFLFNNVPSGKEGDLKNYYEAVIQHNIEMLSDIQKIVKMAKKKMD